MSLQPDHTQQPSVPTLRASRLEALRSRLILAFFIVAMLPFSGISLAITVSQSQGGQKQVYSQLETATSFKQDLINNWTGSLPANLGTALLNEAGADVPTIADIQDIIQKRISGEQEKATRQRIQTHLDTWASQSQNFDQVFILDPDGNVIVSSSPTGGQVPLEGKNFRDQPFFQLGRQMPFVDTPYFSPEEKKTRFYVSYPIVSESAGESRPSLAPQPLSPAQPIGVLAGSVDLGTLYAILNDKTGLGETGQNYLVGVDLGLLAGLRPEDQGLQVRPQEEQGTAGSIPFLNIGQTTANKPTTELRSYTNYKGIPVYGLSRWMPELKAILVAEQARSESARQTLAVLAVNASIALASIVVSLFVALLVTRSIAEPLSELATTATRIASGERSLQPTIFTTRDEVGILSQAFNSMTQQLNSLISSLEQRVFQRTRELEKRSNYLEASAEVGRAATSILDPEELLNRTVELIRERFNLYYVGLFLRSTAGARFDGASSIDSTDLSREWAILSAGTGAAGRAMLERGHRLMVGGGSMIGWCIANAQARIAQVATDDAVRFATPELPETRSEAALPLRSRGRVLGALSVQSDQPNAFDETSIAALQSMTDQLAVAIDNAHLFSQSQEALDAERRAYEARSLAEWQEWFGAQGGSKPAISIQARPGGVTETASIWYPEMMQACQKGKPVFGPQEIGQQTLARLAIPIRVRGAVIGAINTTRPFNPAIGRIASEEGKEPHTRVAMAEAHWTSDEIAFLQDVAEQLGVALDSARLYAETQQRAEQERLVSEVTSRIRASLDIQTVLVTAAREMRDVLQLAEAEIRLGRGEMPSPMRDVSTSGQEILSSLETLINEATLLRGQPDLGYACLEGDEPQPVRGAWLPEMLEARQTGQMVKPDNLTLVIPLKIREQITGVLRLRKPQDAGAWTAQEMDLVEILSDRLSAALESSQLYEETRRRAERERLTSEITARMRMSNDPQTILQTAASELRKALQARQAKVLIQPLSEIVPESDSVNSEQPPPSNLGGSSARSGGVPENDNNLSNPEGKR